MKTQRPNALEILSDVGLNEEDRGIVYRALVTPLVNELDAYEQAALQDLRTMTDLRAELAEALTEIHKPVPMRLICPGRNPDGTMCGRLHIDEGEFATKPHHTHACQHCGEVWRPALVPTVGVQFLPGFKNP